MKCNFFLLIAFIAESKKVIYAEGNIYVFYDEALYP
jgi:hypothetical protein